MSPEVAVRQIKSMKVWPGNFNSVRVGVSPGCTPPQNLPVFKHQAEAPSQTVKVPGYPEVNP